MKQVLFVCTGNICRSPTAEGVARHWASRLGMSGEIEFDSAGTHAYHLGEAPDPRAQRAAKKRGYDLGKLRARPIEKEDFERFDLILAMDAGHLSWLRRECPTHLHHKVELFLNYADAAVGEDVPDPYYGAGEDFDLVLDLCEQGVHGLLDHFR